MKIREITSQDTKQISKLYKQLYPDSNDGIDLTDQSFEAKYLPLCLEEDEEVAGFILGTIIKLGTQKYGYIEDLVVDESKRKQGLGSQLVEYLLNQFITEGVEVVFVSIDIKNENPKDFYKKFGFGDCKNPWLCKMLTEAQSN